MGKDFDTLLCWLAGKIIDYEELATRENRTWYRSIVIKYFPEIYLRPITLRVFDSFFLVGSQTEWKHWQFTKKQFPESSELLDGLHGIGFGTVSEETWYTYISRNAQPSVRLPRFKGIRTEVVPPKSTPISTALTIYHLPVEDKPESKTLSKDIIV